MRYIVADSVSMPKCSEITVVCSICEVSKLSLKFSGCCTASANRCRLSRNIDSRGEWHLSDLQFHNENIVRQTK